MPIAMDISIMKIRGTTGWIGVHGDLITNVGGPEVDEDINDEHNVH